MADNKFKSFVVIGDTHLNCSRVSTRLDDYPITALKKLAQVRKYCVENGIRDVVILGDVFHKNIQNNLYINLVLTEFVAYRNSGISVHSIIGNHDIIQDRLDSLEKSPLNMLFITGVVNHLRILDLGWCILKGVDYSENIEKAPGYDGVKFVFAHMFYNGHEGKDNISSEIDDFGYDAAFLGHDHVTYENERSPGGTLIVRPGSLLRGTSHGYNIKRIPCFDVVSTSGGGVFSVERKYLDVEPADDVFSHEALNRKPKEKTELVSIEKLDDLIEFMSTKESNGSLYAILDKMEMSERARAIIVSYLEAQGIFP